jgi:hypothetical protein
VTTTRYRLFFTWNFDDEELWLDEMSGLGLQLREVAVLRYRFDTDPTKRYRYRLEPPTDAEPVVVRADRSEPATVTGLEAGMEYVCSSSSGWAYYRKEVGADEPEPPADLDSKIERYNRLLAVLGIATFNIVILLANTLFTLLDIDILNVVVAVVLGLGCLVAVIALVQVYGKVARLKKARR